MPGSRPMRLVSAAIAFLGCVAAGGPGAPIEVAVTNVASARGRIHVEICSEKVFLTNDCLYYSTAPAVAGTTIVTIPGVPPGRYAAQSFQDLNDNGRIDRNLLGLPREPVGVSNDAPFRLGPPRFADAAFEHGAVPQRLTLKLRGIF